MQINTRICITTFDMIYKEFIIFECKKEYELQNWNHFQMTDEVKKKSMSLYRSTQKRIYKNISYFYTICI